jgi:hypothetical protein
MARHEGLRTAISSLEEALSSFEAALTSLKAVLPDIEADLALAVNIRKITAATGALVGDTGAKLTAAVHAAGASNGAKRTSSSKPRAKAKSKTALSAQKKTPTPSKSIAREGRKRSHPEDQKVYDFIHGQGTDGTSKKDIVKATGYDGEKLRGILDRLRERSTDKVKSRGKTTQTRYFAS